MEFVRENILLILVAFVSGAMLLWPMVRRGASGPWVNATEATRLINREEAVLIDVRDSHEYASGHPLGAKNLPLAQLESRAGEIEKLRGRPVIVLCDSGSRAGKALAALRARGFDRVFNLAGGYGAWAQAGLPVEK